MVLHTDKVFMWTDSQVTLCYIRNEQRRFSNYVMNRTHETREKTEVKDRNYVPGELNVSDVCTRTVNEVQVGETWIKGPDFLNPFSAMGYYF